MKVKTFDTIVWLTIVIEAVTDNFSCCKLKTTCLIDIGCIFASEKQVTVDETILDQGLEDMFGFIWSAWVQDFFYCPELGNIN